MTKESLVLFWQENSKRFAYLAIFGCLMFASELANFTLTIDEEIAIRHSEPNPTWIRQGRWGMYVVSALFLPTPVLPFVPLMIGIVFSALSFVLITHALALNDRVAWYLAAPVFMGCPTLFYAYQFSTFNFGIGVGFFFTALGVMSFRQEHPVAWILAALSFSFAIATYQSFLLVAIVLYLGFEIVHATTGSSPPWRLSVRRTLQYLSCLVFALVLYYLVQAFFFLLHETSANSYTSNYLNLAQSLMNWQSTLLRTFEASKSYYLGAPGVYGIGIPALYALFVAAVAVIFFRIFLGRSQLTSASRALLALLVLILLITPFAMHLTNLGRMPTRALVALPVVLALVVYLGIAGSGSFIRPLLIVLSGVTAIQFAAANNRFSLQDSLAWNADRALAIRLQTKIDELGVDSTAPIPLEIVGVPGDRNTAFLGQRETIASSFFNHNGGNINRVVYFLDTLELGPYRAALPEQRRALMPATMLMDSWPARGSVRLIEGIVVVKFGDYTHQQSRSICGPLGRDGGICRQELE